MAQVYLRCVQDGRKLRVRITSPGYNNEANCQFPRAIRVNGRTYSAPASAISFARGPAGKFFYRVRKSDIRILEGVEDVTQNLGEMKVTVDKIYGDDDTQCKICLDADRDVVIVPCGHYCMCADCANIIAGTTGKCPICRGRVDLVVTRDQIQT